MHSDTPLSVEVVYMQLFDRMVKWPFEDSVQCLPSGNTLHWGKVPQKAACALNQCLVYCAFSIVGFMSLEII